MLCVMQGVAYCADTMAKRLPFVSYGIKEGMKYLNIYGVDIDEKGILYLNGMTALVTYDGVEFRDFVIEEAGGKVTDFEGKPWSIDSKDVLATNGKIHEEILKIINS